MPKPRLHVLNTIDLQHEAKENIRISDGLRKVLDHPGMLKKLAGLAWRTAHIQDWQKWLKVPFDSPDPMLKLMQNAYEAGFMDGGKAVYRAARRDVREARRRVSP